MKRPPYLVRYLNALRHKRGGAVAERRRQKLRSLVQPAQVANGRSLISPLRLSLGLGTAVLLSVLLCIHLMPNHVSWRVGDIADREIVAPRTVRYVDTEATRLIREEAASQVERRYEPIPGATAAALDVIRILFERIAESKSLPASATVPDISALIYGPGSSASPIPPVNGKPVADKSAVTIPSAPSESKTRAERIAAEVRQQTGASVPVDAVALILQQKPDMQNQASDIARQLVTREMSRAITDNTDELREARENLRHAEILATLPSPQVRDAVAAIAGAALRPTRYYNASETDRERQNVEAAIPLQMRRVTAGTVILRTGERVTPQHIDQFTALGLQSSRPDSLTISVITLLIFCLTGLVALYLRQFHPEIYQSNSSLLLLAILSVISVAGLKIGSTLLGLSAPGMQFGYLGMMCVASAGMVIALLLSPRAALLVVALLSAVSGIILNNELRFALVTLGSSLTGIVAVSALKNRNDLLRAAFLLCGSNALLNVLVGQLEGDVPIELGMSALWGIVAGVFALALFYFGVAIFEKWFGITTHLRLLELSDPATPLLQEFRLRVPGTYAHSLMVSNLAHAAAEAIGADALLVRVAAYYHDIGKMNRPEFFIENQNGIDNIHDRLAPSLSAIILASHVKEGVEIAVEIGLPPRVRELIEQHHGTTLMRYFYHRASQGTPDPMLEAQFRYPGPKPQTREAAILMLADSVEAASRTLQRPTPSRITEFVARIVEEKRADDQLTECDLTLRDLATVQEVFVRTLCGTLHARIEYPSEKKISEPITLANASVGGTVDRPRNEIVSESLPPSLSLSDLDSNLTQETKGPMRDLYPLLHRPLNSEENPLASLNMPEAVPEELTEAICPAIPLSLAEDASYEAATADTTAPFPERETSAPNHTNGTYDSDTNGNKPSVLGAGKNGGVKSSRKRR